MIDSLPKDRANKPEHLYLRAKLIERGGDSCDAANAFDFSWRRANRTAELDRQSRLAINLAKCGKCKRAYPLLVELADQKGRALKAYRTLAATCALALNRPQDAITQAKLALTGRIGREDQISARLTLARALAQKKDKQGVADALIPVLIRSPLHKAEPAALELLGSDLAKVLTLEQRLRRIGSLYRKRRFEQALSELDALGKTANRQQRARSLHLRGMSLFRSRDRYREAARVLAQASKLGGKSQRQDAFHAARALSRADRDNAAIAAYKRFARKNRGHRLAFEAQYLASWLQIRKRSRAGEIGMQKLLKRRGLPGDLRRKALWQLGFRAFERRRYKRSIDYMEQSAHSSVSSMDKARAFYWLGRSYQQSKRHAEAVNAFSQSIQVESLHWYALLAADRLEELATQPPPLFNKSSIPSDRHQSVSKLNEGAMFFSSLGLTRQAVQELERARRSKKGKKGTSVSRRQRVESLVKIGAPNLALRQARTMAFKVNERPDAHNGWWWAAAYPTPWRAIVDSAAKNESIDPWLVYATMRQESGYNSNAVSRADAIGLLQLLVKTAQRAAETKGIEVNREKLFDPEMNIILGVAEMAKQHDAYDGQFPLSIAAYNAGDKRVRRWLREAKSLELDRFVENIPFDETRNYVRRVVTHRARYQFLYGSEQSRLLKLPKRLKH